MPYDTLSEILGDYLSDKHNDVPIELLRYSYNHNTLELSLESITV